LQPAYLVPVFAPYFTYGISIAIIVGKFILVPCNTPSATYGINRATVIYASPAGWKTYIFSDLL
jgi:hypothetical protein